MGFPQNKNDDVYLKLPNELLEKWINGEYVSGSTISEEEFFKMTGVKLSDIVGYKIEDSATEGNVVKNIWFKKELHISNDLFVSSYDNVTEKDFGFAADSSALYIDLQLFNVGGYQGNVTLAITLVLDSLEDKVGKLQLTFRLSYNSSMVKYLK